MSVCNVKTKGSKAASHAGLSEKMDEWDFAELEQKCDEPGEVKVQSILVPDDDLGFALYARQGKSVHRVTVGGRQVRFRTIEKALATLVDVAHLDSDIVLKLSTWRTTTGLC